MHMHAYIKNLQRANTSLHSSLVSTQMKKKNHSLINSCSLFSLDAISHIKPKISLSLLMVAVCLAWRQPSLRLFRKLMELVAGWLPNKLWIFLKPLFREKNMIWRGDILPTPGDVPGLLSCFSSVMLSERFLKTLEFLSNQVAEFSNKRSACEILAVVILYAADRTQ